MSEPTPFRPSGGLRTGGPAKVILRVLLGVLLVTGSVRADDLILSAQKALQEMGYYQGRLDGIAGSQTAAAIRRYQIAKKLTVTGELTPQTLDSLGLKPPPPKR